MPSMRWAEELAGAGDSAAMRRLWASESRDSRGDLPGHLQTDDALVSGDVALTSQRNGATAISM